MVQNLAAARVDRRRAILEAAAAVFRRQGLAATGMRDIAAELGMAVGNLYYYFASKEELLTYCHEEGLAGLVALVERVGRLDLPADARLYLLIVGHVRQINEATPGALAHLALDLGATGSPPDSESALATGSPESALVAGRRAYEHAVRELIRQGIASGRFRPVDPKLAALAVLGASNWTARWFRPDGPRSAAAIGEDFAGLLIRGLLAEGVPLTVPDLRLLDAPTSTAGSGRLHRPLAGGRKHP